MSRFEHIKLGNIRPKGWIKDQLMIQANGFSGHLEEEWEDVGPRNGWIGGDGESWERGPYYLDGLLPLAYLLEDQVLIGKAQKWIEWTLKSQKADGSFGPDTIVTVNTDVNKKVDWWHFMIMLKVLVQYEEVTGDPRVEPFISNFLDYVLKHIEASPLEGWAMTRGAELLMIIGWMIDRRPSRDLENLKDIIIKQTTDWTGLLADFPYTRKVSEFHWETHVVNVAMGIKTPGIIDRLEGNTQPKGVYYEAIRKGIDSIMTHHGQAHGMFSGDEWLSGTSPSQGVELCAVVEYMYTMEQLISIYGDGMFGDILEKVAFNALPAPISCDWTSHQYNQQVNQIICNRATRNWSNREDANMFGLEPNFGCCTANMHQGWPKLVTGSWFVSEDSLMVGAYIPCEFETYIKDNSVKVEVETFYPFRDMIKIFMNLDKKDTLSLKLRIPAWCKEPELMVNGQKLDISLNHGYVTIDREWDLVNEISLKLPMEVNLEKRPNNSGYLTLGPVVYSLPLEEKWVVAQERNMFHDYEVYPGSRWQYGIIRTSPYTVDYGDIPLQPFESNQAPVRIEVQVESINNWNMTGNNAGEPPIVSDRIPGSRKSVYFVPYGGAKLRMTEMPLLD